MKPAVVSNQRMSLLVSSVSSFLLFILHSFLFRWLILTSYMGTKASIVRANTNRLNLLPVEFDQAMVDGSARCPEAMRAWVTNGEETVETEWWNDRGHLPDLSAPVSGPERRRRWRSSTDIRRRLAYLCAPGVDAIWVSPFYPSPMADFGYDVADYRDVDPALRHALPIASA